MRVNLSKGVTKKYYRIRVTFQLFANKEKLIVST